MKKIYILDDHDVVRFGLTMLINSTPSMHVVGEASSLQDALKGIGNFKPDLVISDLALGDSKGLDTVKAVVRAQQGRATLFVSMHDEVIYGEQAIKLGARGYLMKNSAQQNVLQAAQAVLNDLIWVSPKIGTQMLSRMASGTEGTHTAADLAALSTREAEVLEHLGAGMTTKQIAFALGISTRTVDVHRGHLKQKLKLKSGSKLIAYAVAHLN